MLADQMKQIVQTHPVILRILKGIEEARPVGAHRQAMWERCWDENEAPDYFVGDVFRYEGSLYEAPAGVELAEFEKLRARVFGQWFSDVQSVCEFGCGTGQNLAVISKMGKQVVGFDWASSAVQRCLGSGIYAKRFDMFSPDGGFNGALLTIHALEQLGRRWHAFLNYVMRSKPPVCVHIEPIEEFYSEGNLLDYLALQYHRKREYLSGFYTQLKKMSAAGEVEILQEEKSHFGSLFHEAYSVIVWRPA